MATTTITSGVQMDRETSFLLEICEDVISAHTPHDGCPATPCADIAYHVQRRAEIVGGGRVVSLTDPQAGGDGTGHRPDAGSRAANQFGTFTVKYATGPQIRFIERLLATKDLSNLTERNERLVAKAREALVEGRINKRLASDVLDVLTTTPDLPKAAAPEPEARRRNRFGGKCIRCGQWVQEQMGYLAKDATGRWAAEHTSECPTPPAKTTAARTLTREDAGVYVTPDGTVYRVYFGQQSGRMLAKRVEGDTFVYAGQADRFVLVEGTRKMTLDEAKEWGKTTGTCIACGRELDVPESVDAGIGPICAKRW